MVKELFLKLKHKKILEEMDKIEISEKALTNYKYNVNNNRRISRELLTRKLKRNFMLAEKVDDRTVRYGNLHIFHNDNLIEDILNVKGGSDGLNISRKFKQELSFILGL